MRHPRKSPRPQANGSITVEFVLMMMASLALIVPVGEFYRLSLIDQALAKVTHEGARSAAADAVCEQAVVDAFNANPLAVWLLDLNDDNRIAIVTNPDASVAWPSGSATDEAHVSVVADDNLFDGSDWEVATGCGSSGSWILVSSRIVVEPWFRPLGLLWPDGIRREQQSWARNQW